MHTTPRLGLLLTVMLAAILVACSSPAGASPSAPASQPPASEAPTEEPSSAAPTAETPTDEPSAGSEIVSVAESDLGQILVGEDGRTLYLFTPDTAGESTCYDECATNWPPLLADGDITVGAGLDDSDFSTVERTDGTMQVKIGEWPLYYFAADTAAGDTNGQGVGEKWYVVSPTGEMIQ